MASEPAMQLRGFAPYVATDIHWDMSPEGLVPEGNLTDDPLPSGVMVVVPFFGRDAELAPDYGERTVAVALSMAYGRHPIKAIIMADPDDIVEWLDTFDDHTPIPSLAPPPEVTGMKDDSIINAAFHALAGYKRVGPEGGFLMEADGTLASVCPPGTSPTDVMVDALADALMPILREALGGAESPTVSDLFPGDAKMADLDESLRRQSVAYQKTRNAHLN